MRGIQAVRACRVALVACVVAPCARGDVLFTDVTAASGIAMTHQAAPLMVPGSNEWLLAGVCVIDYDRDGWPDVFALKGGVGSDRLFRNNGDGTFSDVTEAAGLVWNHGGASCAVGDFDRDGWPDLFVGSYGNGGNNQGQVGRNRLYRNNGDGTFTDVAVAAGVHQNTISLSSVNGVAWGDYDLDGDLDLFVAAWSLTAGGNRLYRNEGNGAFTDVTGGSITIPPSWGFQPAFADMDGDGYPEILLAADFATSRYWVNQRNGAFIQTTFASGLGIDDNGMGQCIGDFDNDGDLDWYVTSIFQEIGGSGHNGNAYYRNDAPHAYVEISQQNGTNDGGWGWGAVAGDFDHDGWLDIIEVNGRNSTEWGLEPEYYFRNLGGGMFLRDDAVSAQFLNADARTIVTLDFDRDGDLDVLIYYNFGPLKLYRNDSTPARSWLQVAFDVPAASRVAPDGYGVRAIARVGKDELVRYLDGGNGYLGSSELILHWGLADAKEIDELRIEWPRGNATTLGPLAVNQRIVVTTPVASDLNADGQVDSADLALLLGAWGPVGALQRSLDIDDDGAVGSSDLAILLGAWNP